jgi:starch synthase
VRVLIIASEAAPWAKTGGLADVAGALPAALAALGHDVTLILPRYRGIATEGAASEAARITQGSRPIGVTFHTREHAADLRTVFVDAPELFDRPHLYGDATTDYPDNAARFDALGLAALHYATTGGRPAPDVIHAHDWQACFAIGRLATENRWQGLATTGRVLTIHNLAYQGLFPRETLPSLNLPWSLFRVETGEFWGKFSALKAGMTTADYVTTVSPTYAAETLTPEFGAGLEGVLQQLRGRYVGILNGIDTRVWDPATDPHLPATFSAEDRSGKAVCKRALLAECGLPQGDDAMARPLIGMISRLVAQKGLDQFEAARDRLVAVDASWVFLGSGEPRYERLLRDLAAQHPSRVAVRIGFDERFAHLIEAAADMFLMPSAFEPCGLNQMYSLRYGTVPIVRAVGGLHDTIQPYTARARNANGFKFNDGSAATLVRTVRQAVRLYRNPPVWDRLVRNGMTADHSWERSAREYGKVYRRARAAAADRGGPVARR